MKATKQPNDPRVTINKLVKCMKATPAKFRKIIDDQKNPLANKPKMAWCSNAKKRIVEFVAHGCSDEAILHSEITRLSRLPAYVRPTEAEENKRTQIQVDIDALTAFLGLYQDLKLEGYNFMATLGKAPTLNFSGVHISVHPEVHVIRNWKIVGCLKFYFTKNDHLSDEEGSVLSALLKHYAEKYLARDHAIKPEACMVIDIFGGRIFCSSTNVDLQIGKIRDICSRIRQIWPGIETRPPIVAKPDQDDFNFLN